MRQLEQVLKVLADKNRMRILKLLERRKMCVCELAFVLQVTQPSISRHLKRMKESGLIGDEQDGFWTNYFLQENPKAGGDIISCIKSFLKDDEVIKADRGRLKKADRTKLCCR